MTTSLQAGLAALDTRITAVDTKLASVDTKLASVDTGVARLNQAITPTVVSAVATAPIASAVIADSGQLAAGTYRVEVAAGFSDTLAAGKHLVVEHRDAANTGNINTLGLVPAGVALDFTVERVVVALNQRIRVVNGAVAGAAGSVAHGAVRVYLLPV